MAHIDQPKGKQLITSKPGAGGSRPGRWIGALTSLSLGTLMLASAPPTAAFGGAGNLGECAAFTTCTAGVASGADTFVQYNFSSIGSGYHVPTPFGPGLTAFQDVRSRQTNMPVVASNGICGNPPCIVGPFHSVALARGGSDFGVNRGSASTSLGAAGTDEQTFGQTVLGSASVQILTVANADSAWRDVWSFNAAGHLSAVIDLDGHSSMPNGNGTFPDTFTYALSGALSEWFYRFDVWDVTHLSVSEDFELGGPTLVARVRDQHAGSIEQRPSFASSLALDFDFESGVSYVVTSQLGVRSRNGSDIDLYNTARLTDVALSSGATLNALSGHDYFAGPAQPVPEPGTTSLLVAGLACLGLWSRRRARREL